MKSGEARLLLGFSPHSRPSPPQIKAAYKRKVWDVHPDRFPADQRIHAESQFKLISQAYTCLLNGGGTSAKYASIVRTGAPRAHVGGRHHPLVAMPFLFIILGTIGVGGASVARAYRKEKEANSSHNPFLP